MMKRFFIAIKSVYYNTFYKRACKYTVLVNRNNETGTELDYENRIH